MTLTDGHRAYAPLMDRPRKTNCDPVGAADIAERLGLQRQTVAKWRRRHDDFPDPRWYVSGQPAWEWTDIPPWLARSGRQDLIPPEEEESG
jgi:hypothetical protein